MGGSHRIYYLVHNGKKQVIRTMVKHSKKEYGNTLISLVAKQMRLTKKELLLFVKCDIDGEKYVEILRKKGIIGSR